jgi:hypothetical protein
LGDWAFARSAKGAMPAAKIRTIKVRRIMGYPPKSLFRSSWRRFAIVAAV